MNTPPVFLVICEIAFALADSHNEINRTASSSDTQQTTPFSVKINSAALKNSENLTTVTTDNIINITRVVETITSIPTIVTAIDTSTATSINTTTSTNRSETVPSFSLSNGWHLTRILTKKGIDLTNHNDKSIQIATPDDGDFQSFIRDSALWVDKSLLVRKIWEGLWNFNALVIAPPKWGKTINLSMFKFYCELALDANGFETPKSHSASHLYFNEGKVVSRNGTIQELDALPLISGYDDHLANHPVIYMSGINLTMENCSESLRMMIHKTYQRHGSLLRRLEIEYRKASPLEKPFIEKDIEQFRAFYDLENVLLLKKSQFVRGIRNLTELLFNVYKRKVVVLFDDYEYYIYKTYFADRLANFSDSGNDFSVMWDRFIFLTFEDNEQLEKAIITGAVKAFDPSTRLSWLNFYKACVFDEDDLFPYYGIFEKEFFEMARLRDIDKGAIENATQWYGGYRTLSHLDIQMYSPYSTTRFISTLLIRDYRPASCLSDFIKKLIRKPILKQRICSLVNDFIGNETYPTGVFPQYFEGLTLQQYAELQKLSLGQMRYFSLHEDQVGSILVSSGCAAVHHHNHKNYYILIRVVPNREIYNLFSNILKEK